MLMGTGWGSKERLAACKAQHSSVQQLHPLHSSRLEQAINLCNLSASSSELYLQSQSTAYMKTRGSSEGQCKPQRGCPASTIAAAHLIHSEEQCVSGHLACKGGAQPSKQPPCPFLSDSQPQTMHGVYVSLCIHLHGQGSDPAREKPVRLRCTASPLGGTGASCLTAKPQTAYR